MERKIRKATPEDYNKVMAISENGILYGGYDHLPNEYYTLLSWHGGYVLEINDRIVGFLGYELVDKGTCFIPCAGRIAPSMQGQGLFKYLMEEAASKIKEEFPKVKTSRMSTSNKNSFKERIMSSRRRTCSVLYYCVEVGSKTDFASYGLQPKITKENVLKVLKDEELQTLCDDAASAQSLSSMGYMLVDWKFYKFNKTDASTKWKCFGNFHCFASFGKGDTQSKNANAMTLAYITLCGLPESSSFKRLLGLDIHGHLTKDLLIEHLSFAFNYFKEKKISFDETRITVRELHEDILKSIFPSNSGSGQAMCFERGLVNNKLQIASSKL